MCNKETIQYIGKIDRRKLGYYKTLIMSEEVILTEERRQHIIKRHNEDYILYKNKLNYIIKCPKYILEDYKNKNTLLFIASIQNENINLVIKLNVYDGKEYIKNSIITLWRVRDKNLEKLINKNRTIYKKE